MQHLRLPRFERAQSLAPIKLTDRDRNIIRLVHRHRFLRSTHILALVAGSSQQLLRRLQVLYHHGYLERPRCQIDYYYRTGTQPMAYGLGSKGASLLEQEFGVNIGKIRWGEKNRAIGRPQLEHVLFVSEIMVAIELACRKSARVRLLDREEIIPPGNPFRWKVPVNSSLTLGPLPDQLFALEFESPNGTTERICFILEADRGTMPVIRKDFSQTSMYRKFVAYAATWEQEILRTHFAINRFRVFIVTESKERIRSLIDACAGLESGQRVFLFADIESFKERDPLSFEWHTGRKGEFSSLLD